VYDDPNADAAAKAAADKAAADAAEKAKGKTFTQEELNAIVARERAADKDAKAKLIQQLEEAKTKVTMTASEKEEYEKQLEELRKATMSKEEIANRERKKLEEKLTKERDDALSLSKTWQKRFEDSTIIRNLMDAAMTNEAFAPQQVVAILSPNARVVEMMDESGKPSGNYDVVVKFNDVDSKSGKPIQLELPSNEVVKRMKELSNVYGNLFKNGVSEGMGGNNGKGGKPVDFSKMTPTEYKEHRKKMKEKGEL